MLSIRYRAAAAGAAAILIICFLTSLAPAQVPSVAVYFDEALSQTSQDCQGNGTIDTLYVVALNFNDWISAIEFSVGYTPVSAFTTPWA